MSLSENIHSLLKSKAVRLLLWFILWFTEFLGLKWIMDKSIIPPDAVQVIKVVLVLLAVYCVIYWCWEKRSQEYTLYTIAIAAFVIYGLYTPQRFYSIYNHKFNRWLLILLGYISFRIFLLPIIVFIFSSLVKAIKQFWNESAQERAANHERVKKEREQNLKDRRERHVINHRHAIDFWKHFFSLIKTFIVGFKDFFSAPFTGFARSKAQNQSKTSKEDAQSKETAISSIWFWYCVIFVALVLFVLYFASKSSVPFLSELNNENDTASKKLALLAEIAISFTIFVIVIASLAAILMNVIIQLACFLKIVLKDLSSSKEKTKSITLPIIFSITAILVILWLRTYYPFEADDLAKALSSGALVIYPVALMLIYVIISFFTRWLDQETIKKFLEKEEEKAKSVVTDILSLALDSIRSLVSYLKLVTGDFLTSIMDLADEEKIDDDLEE